MATRKEAETVRDSLRIQHRGASYFHGVGVMSDWGVQGSYKVIVYLTRSATDADAAKFPALVNKVKVSTVAVG